MNQIHLKDVDMNLLVALDVLLTVGSVSEAARQVGLSQSAMSHTLGRLREVFGDELLVRSGRHMVPTERAQELAGPLKVALEALQVAVSPPERFEPASSARVFRLATNDYAQFVLLPPLIERLEREAPGIDLRVRELGRSSPVERLATGQLDLVLTLGLPEHVPETLYRKDLFQLDLVSVVRRGHPGVGKTLDLDTYCNLSHILVSPRGDDEGVVDMTLAERGRSRRVAVVVPHFMVAPHLVAATDYVLTTSRSVAESFANYLPLRIFEPPVELERGTVSMAWHPRTHRSGAHKWLRRTLEEVAVAQGLKR
ncbi:LysR family transcriptional regulator [Lujinxingia sediminis]|nr:LysR family transcriptional regulator [Lujinxingia sediminis]